MTEILVNLFMFLGAALGVLIFLVCWAFLIFLVVYSAAGVYKEFRKTKNLDLDDPDL